MFLGATLVNAKKNKKQKTVTAAASGTVATAAKKQSKVDRLAPNTGSLRHLHGTMPILLIDMWCALLRFVYAYAPSNSKQCKCLDPKGTGSSGCTGKCGAPAYKGDGNCDDENK